MRNLKLEYRRQLESGVKDGEFLVLDPNERGTASEILYIVKDTKLLGVYSATGDVKEITEVPNPVGAEYLALNMQICLATDVGEVLTVDPGTGAVNECTFCDVGLQCMSWSPDQEVVSFVTKSDMVVVMTCTFDVIAEHVLADQCTGQGQFINVGWGKKETQFHGSEGKTAARKVDAFHSPENVNEIQKTVEISWRGDSAFFVVSFVSPTVGRMFKVFDKEGNLMYISEHVNGLQPPIAWRPTGSWIAVPQLFPNKSTISLFEKNGLRHREIVLQFDINTEPIKSLRWNSGGDILTVETHDAKSGKHNLYLYTIGNYHWYLKQALCFDAADPITLFCWDQRIGEEHTMHVLLHSGKYLLYRWRYDVDRFGRSGIVGVIDGNKLLLTDFSKAVVPPPMCSKELQLDVPINALCINMDGSPNLNLLIYDANEQLHLFEAPQETPINFEKVAVLQQKDQEQKTLPLELGNMFLFKENCLVATTTDTRKSKVIRVKTDLTTGSYSCTKFFPINGNIGVVCKGDPELKHLFVQYNDHKIGAIALTQDMAIKYVQKHAWLEHSAEQMQWDSGIETDSLVTLLHNQRLYINDQKMAGDVTSFCFAGNYLVYTQLTALHFVLLANRQHVYTRSMERGGKLVTTIANDARVVLQMPRGNLELISPRVLTLEIVGEFLNNFRYHEAFDILRKQRINLNIICDHNMVSFMENLDVFLKSIKNPQWLNLFLSELQNEDFTQTMYVSNYTAGAQQYPNGFKIEQKVSYLCEKICERMVESNEERFRLPIITTYVKMGNLEQALLLIWQEKKKLSSQTNFNADNSDAADDALKYLLYLVDVNDLYNVALGTYDFGLVLFVAQRSQKDPKEFLPFLNDLKSLETNYRKFKIDEHLKRYEKALQHIAQCGAAQFSELLSFVKRHGLYQQALQYFRPSKDDVSMQQCYEQLCLAFGDYLRACGLLENASIMYERGGNLTQALLSAKHVLDWQRVLMLAHKDGQDMVTTALSLVGALEEHGQHEVAYELSKTYGNDLTAALQCLLKGKLFLKAIFEARLSEAATTCIDESIKPELLSYSAVLRMNLVEDEHLYVTYKRRLATVREQAKQKKEGVFNGDEPHEVDEADLLSDTTSMRSSRYTGSSRGTGKTFRSSKNRRKHERKMLSLKPGNPFEDIALIDALYNHITKLVSQQQQVRDTCKALLELQQDDEAAMLQQQFKRLLALLQDSLDEIWTPELALQSAQQWQPNANCDFTQLQNEQRYALLTPYKRFKPQLALIEWTHEILN